VKIEGLDHVALTVTDVPRSVAWYRDTLGFERYYEEAWGDRPAVVGAGGTGLALFGASAPASAAQPAKNALTVRHVAFRTDRVSWEELRARLSRDAVPYEVDDHGISQSIYFDDPDGHQVEVTTYDV
jgi:catechol 2,3-dioxygenase-like lactoylglutathione lyase family enzyme